MIDRLSFWLYVLRFWRELAADLWAVLCAWRTQRARALRNGWHVYRTRRG